MKKLFNWISKGWFFSLKWWQMIICVHFVLSFALVCCLSTDDVAFMVASLANFALAVFLIRLVPTPEGDDIA